MSFSIFHRDPDEPIDQFLRDNLLDLREKSGFLILEKQVLTKKDAEKNEGKIEYKETPRIQRIEVKLENIQLAMHAIELYLKSRKDETSLKTLRDDLIQATLQTQILADFNGIWGKLKKKLNIYSDTARTLKKIFDRVEAESQKPLPEPDQEEPENP
ncbi:MAG: hypothetical protein ACYCQI_10330 [Gammaproteobacteria bacterium]